MKQETFKQAKQIEKDLKDIIQSLTELRSDQNGYLNAIRIHSAMPRSSSQYFNVQLNSQRECKIEGLNEKENQMIAILSETYREQIINILKRAESRLNIAFDQLEDLS